MESNSRTQSRAWKELKHTCKMLDEQYGDRWFAYLHLGKVGLLVKKNTYHTQQLEQQHDTSNSNQLPNPPPLQYIMIVVVADRIYHTFDDTLDMLFQQGSHSYHGLAYHHATSSPILISGWHKHHPMSNIDCYATIASLLDQECQEHYQTHVGNPDVTVDRIIHFTNYHPL
jgi:hypothetical protein